MARSEYKIRAGSAHLVSSGRRLVGQLLGIVPQKLLGLVSVGLGLLARLLGCSHHRLGQLVRCGPSIDGQLMGSLR